MNRKPVGPGRRRNRLLEWLFGAPPVPRRPAPNSLQADAALDAERTALLGRSPQPGSPASVGEEQRRPVSVVERELIPRAMFRVDVRLPANLDLGGQKVVPVRIANIGGMGAAIIYDSPDPIEPTGHWLDLALPNRPKPLELELEIVASRPHTGAQGQPQQILHVKFATIRRNEQDAIVAYVNNVRLYEGKQYSVAAKVMLEVVTGRRRFAKFSGETIEIRPDQMRLMMDDFDAIAGAEVMLTIMAPHFSDHLDVDDVKIDKVEVVGPRKAEVEVSLAKPDDKILLFIRKHYPGVAKGRR